MQKIDGKEVLETLEELIAPSHTVFLIHDMQNDFYAPGGKLFEKAGISAQDAAKTVSRICDLLEAARRAGVMVAFSRASHFPSGIDESPAHLHHLLRRDQRGAEPNVVMGTWGHQIIDELKPKANDLVFDKFTFSSFQGTVLDKVLRMRGVKTIVLAGVASHGGVLTTARIASALDYYVVVAREGVAGSDPKLHEATLELLKPDVYGVSEIIRAWSTEPPVTV